MIKISVLFTDSSSNNTTTPCRRISREIYFFLNLYFCKAISTPEKEIFIIQIFYFIDRNKWKRNLIHVYYSAVSHGVILGKIYF